MVECGIILLRVMRSVGSMSANKNINFREQINYVQEFELDGIKINIEFDPDSSPAACEHYKNIYGEKKEFGETTYDLTKPYFYGEKKHIINAVYKEFEGLHFFPEKVVNEIKKREKDNIYPLEISATENLAGETDFNFNQKRWPDWWLLLKNGGYAEEVERLKICVATHHTLINFSLMQSMGKLQQIKGSCDDRIDVFLLNLNEYFKELDSDIKNYADESDALRELIISMKNNNSPREKHEKSIKYFNKIYDNEKRFKEINLNTHYKTLREFISEQSSTINIKKEKLTNNFIDAKITYDKFVRFSKAENIFTKINNQKSTEANTVALIKYLNSFLVSNEKETTKIANIEISPSLINYCKIIYFINDENLIAALIKSGNQNLTSAENIINYMKLAQCFWDAKEYYFKKSEYFSYNILKSTTDYLEPIKIKGFPEYFDVIDDILKKLNNVL